MNSLVKKMAVAAAAITVLTVGSAQAGFCRPIKIKKVKCAPIVTCNPCPVVYYKIVKPAPVVYCDPCVKVEPCAPLACGTIIR